MVRSERVLSDFRSVRNGSMSRSDRRLHSVVFRQAIMTNQSSCRSLKEARSHTLSSSQRRLHSLVSSGGASRFGSRLHSDVSMNSKDLVVSRRIKTSISDRNDDSILEESQDATFAY